MLAKAGIPYAKIKEKQIPTPAYRRQVRGNDNSAIITIETISIFYLSRIPDNVGISDQMIASFDHQHFLRSSKVSYPQLIKIYSAC